MVPDSWQSSYSSLNIQSGGQKSRVPRVKVHHQHYHTKWFYAKSTVLLHEFTVGVSFSKLLKPVSLTYNMLVLICRFLTMTSWCKKKKATWTTYIMTSQASGSKSRPLLNFLNSGLWNGYNLDLIASWQYLRSKVSLLKVVMNLLKGSLDTFNGNLFSYMKQLVRSKSHNFTN